MNPSLSGRDHEDEQHRQRARPGQRGRRLRGADGRHGRRVRDRSVRVRVEIAEGGRGRTGEQHSTRHVAIRETLVVGDFVRISR